LPLLPHCMRPPAWRNRHRLALWQEKAGVADDHER